MDPVGPGVGAGAISLLPRLERHVAGAGIRDYVAFLGGASATLDRTAENQLIELRRYIAARGWSGVEHVDHGVSGAKDRRPALDHLVADVRRRRVQAVLI